MTETPGDAADSVASPEVAIAKETPLSPPHDGENNNVTTSSLPSKRPSPWRQPREVREANAAAAAEDWSLPIRKKPKKTKGPSRKLTLDAISVQIPLDVTADLGIALQRTRKKRIEALQKAYPELKSSTDKKTETDELAEDNNQGGDKNKGETTADTDEPEKKKKNELNKKKPKHVPQPNDYANVLDYLEAKYVQGVMIDDAEEEMDQDDEGQGSVYSETSFLDDRDLQRNVAEQVLAHTTTTKLELQDDDEFFVNVGNLEVEETELTSGKYDPLEDTKTKPAAKRKRKKSTANGAANKNSKTAAAAESSPQKKKQKTSSKPETQAESNKGKKKPQPANNEKASPPLTPLENRAKTRKAKWEKLFQIVVNMIKNSTSEQLPRRKKAVKVAVTCPANKKPGDSILFANPHIPGQKLKAKIPKAAKPGGVFKVTVPVAKKPVEGDQNKLNREIYDALDNFARAYDDWCDVEGEYRKAIGDKEFTPHFEKRKKFDKMIKEMPKDLLTPLDKPYLQKILRRARQNRHKREQTLARQAARGGDDKSEKASEKDESDDEEEEAPPSSEATDAKPKSKPPAKQLEIPVPELVTDFPTKQFIAGDFK